ncbi:MAG: hypothetical protein GX556_00625 [Fibrobacter sp.]|nr:hypothetical protein [Fibrobacter sp.]
MKHLLNLIFFIVPFSLYAVTNFPFPQNATYPYGIKPSSINSDVVQTSYEDFLSRFYEENGNLARIKFDDPSKTVSEGIGYGMLVMVYMDNAENNTRGKFDKLWAYYNNFLNSPNRLMHWKINGFSGIDQQNAATDAELDVALALMMAHKQWGDEKYLNDAKDLIGKIQNHEVNGNGYLKPGDSWDSKKNPSYFSTAALELFKESGSYDWNRVITNSYSLLKKTRNATTGLVPDWCEENGNALGDYYYDATRTPWRMAMAYVWYGHADAKDVASKMAKWITEKTNGSAKNIVDGYLLDGSNKSQWNVPAFVGPFACAGMVDQSHQAWLDNSFNQLATFASSSDESYYNQSLETMTLILLSGNMPNFWTHQIPQTYTLNVSAQPSAGGTVTKSPSASQYNSNASITLEAVPQNGYRFVGWSGDLSGTETSKTFSITRNMNVTANFEPASGVKLNKVDHRAVGLNLLQNADGLVLEYSIPRGERVKISIHDITGKTVLSAVNGFTPAGVHLKKISASLKSGIYWIRMRSSEGEIVRPATIAR